MNIQNLETMIENALSNTIKESTNEEMVKLEFGK